MTLTSPRAGSAAGTGPWNLGANGGLVEPAPWHTAQVLFAVETTPMDGVADPTSYQGTWVTAAYSDGVPAFLSHAGTVAAEIVRAHAGTHVTFGMIDFFQALYDDGDGSVYHADISNFVNASSFTAQVNSTILRSTLWNQYDSLNDSDASDNLLQSSSIAALYGAMADGNLNWSPRAHHVIVYLGSAAPLGPQYPMNGCVFGSHPVCTLTGCSPSYNFTNGSTSPRCERWVGPSSLGANGSIGGMAYHATNCVRSLGGWCTIDAISYHDMVTDPQLKVWPTPGGSKVVNDTTRILGAACAIAWATDGSWDGPTSAHCRGGRNGTLPFVAQMKGGSVQYDNPALVSAIGNISLGMPLDAHSPLIPGLHALRTQVGSTSAGAAGPSTPLQVGAPLVRATGAIPVNLGPLAALGAGVRTAFVGAGDVRSSWVRRTWSGRAPDGAGPPSNAIRRTLRAEVKYTAP